MAHADGLTLESIRNSLIRQEDTIIFSLIERAKYPIIPQLYDSRCSVLPGISGSLLENIVRETEAIQAKYGRYQFPEEHSFFPDNLPDSLVPPNSYPQVLHPAAASININKTIWDMYINKLLPLIASEGNYENYTCVAASDLECLQALSRRIHYGKFVAEVKFKDASEEYSPAIQAKDRDALMKLLTFESVEEMVKRRVEKKAKVFGQEVNLNNDAGNGKCKIDPSVLPCLYGEWVMPLTKHVEVEYLLRRLD
ncbi:chorismate mutase 2 [Coffea eugenioides]|uniref:Chorismate mutase n=1 Tax=Coffea arabica TaxID=13443 RepID=A0A6P6TMH1_COFAR|nr:chorismate mutase 2-like [Coffea arabica]XP_027181180.1 chorismate mutase 2 [Coffea eugenioides]